MELARGVHEWRTTDGLAKKAKVSPKEIEAICAKYLPLGIIPATSQGAGEMAVLGACPPKFVKTDKLTCTNGWAMMVVWAISRLARRYTLPVLP